MASVRSLTRRSAWCVVVALGWLGLAGSTAFAAPASTCQPHVLGADRRGPARAIARSGTRVFLGAGAALVVVDAADPLNPVELGYANLGGIVRDVASWGWTAMALIPDAIEFVNADDPLHPYVAGTFPLPPEWQVPTIDARDAMVYFPAPDGLHIVSFADPAAPEEIGTFAIADAADVVARTGLAYLLAAGAIHVLDTSNPASPVEIAAVPSPEEANDRITVAPSGTRLATSGATSLVGHSWGEVAFFDLVDPELPVLRSHLYYGDDDPPGAVALGGGRAFVSHGDYLEVFDLADLANPILSGTFPAGWIRNLFVAPDPDYLLLADAHQGLRVFDIEPPSAAHEVAAVGTPGESLDGLFVGTLAVTSNTRGLRIYDLSAPARPVLVGRSATTDTWLSDQLRGVGSFAYAQAWDYPSRNFVIFDLADPTAPAQVGSFGAGIGLYPLTVDRGLALSPSGSPAPLFDVSDPAQPFQVGELSTQGLGVWDAELAGGRAYAWTFGSSQPTRLWIFDVSDPAAPIELGMSEMPDSYRSDSEVAGRLLLVCGGTEFAVFDVADPTDVQQLGSLPVPSSQRRRRISLYGARAFLDPEYSEWPLPRTFRVVDIADPHQPTEAAALLTMGPANHVFAGPGLIGVAEAEAGLAFYESCVPFADGFESGDAGAWSSVSP